MSRAARLVTVSALAAIAALTVSAAVAQGQDGFVCNIRGEFRVGPSSSVAIGRYLLAGAGIVVASSLGARLFAQRIPAGGSAGHWRLNLLAAPLCRAIISPPAVAVLKGAAIALLVITVIAGIIGRSTLPAMVVWLYFGAGVAILSAFVGNVWAVINPWKTAYDLLERWFPQLQGAEQEWPEGFGVWPALALFASFRWVELVFPERFDPGILAVLIILYSVVTLGAMWYFGKRTWLHFGDPFAVFFRLLSRLSPTEVRVEGCTECDVCHCACDVDSDGCVNCHECYEFASERQQEVNLRPYGAGLEGGRRPDAWEIPFVLFIFSSLAFAAFRISGPWGDLANSLNIETRGQLVFFDTLGLAGLFVAALTVYHVVSLFVRALTRSDPESEQTTASLVYALLPMAAAFMLAHYLRFLLVDGQQIIGLVSDPFGLSWDLFGTAGYRPDYGLPAAVHLWKIQAGSLFLAAVLSVHLLHRVSLQTPPGRWEALRGQVYLTALGGGYLAFNLWLLWAVIVSSDC